MIYLITGANGAGKTLNTLKFVREKQVAEGRSVYYHGFAMDAAKAAEFGWQEFDPKEWQKLPDGAILIVDECQNEFPVRPSSAPLPEYVRALSEHRKHGFDFFMVTQHPQNIDMFVRRLIGSPGWHRHLKRTFGADMVSVLEWSAVNGTCEKDGAGKSARVSMVAFPKEVYSWYASASLHTGKRSIPRQVYILCFLVVLIPLMIWAAVHRLTAKAAPALAGPVASSSAPAGVRPGQSSLTPAEFAATFAPRVTGLAQTAPRYDEVTKPITAPYPAACVNMGDRCGCYSQQGTKLDVPFDLCKSIVSRGFFVDWQANPVAAAGAGQAGQQGPVKGNPGSSPAVTAPEPSKPLVVASASDLAALEAMHIGKRLVSSH